MKLYNARWMLTLVALVAAGARADDLSGKWTAEIPGYQGQTERRTFTFQASGEKLTGTVNETAISDGKVIGDEISFTVTTQNQWVGTIKQLYTGKLVGSEIHFKVKREGRDQVDEFTAKRASE